MPGKQPEPLTWQTWLKRFQVGKARLTPELLAKLKEEHQLTLIETWFGFMLAKLYISRRFFPFHWCFRFKG
jgi:hypothetical protein